MRIRLVQSRKPPSTSSAPNKTLPLAPHSTSYYSHHLPPLIIDHVDHLLNPKLDGHCGFWAAAFVIHWDEEKWPRICNKVFDQIANNKDHYRQACLVLNVEAALRHIKFDFNEDADKNSCGEDKWMALASTSYALANLYERPFFFSLNHGLKPCSLPFPLQMMIPLSSLH